MATARKHVPKMVPTAADHGKRIDTHSNQSVQLALLRAPIPALSPADRPLLEA